VVLQGNKALVPTATGGKKEYMPSAQLSKRIPSAWPRPVWHAPWKMYRVVAGHLGCVPAAHQIANLLSILLPCCHTPVWYAPRKMYRVVAGLSRVIIANLLHISDKHAVHPALLCFFTPVPLCATSLLCLAVYHGLGIPSNPGASENNLAERVSHGYADG